MLATYGALLALASPVAAIIATSFIMALFKKSRTELKWYHILGGLVVLKLTVLIPILGGLAGFVVYLLAVDAIAQIVATKFAA